MCGFIQRTTDSPHVRALLDILGIDLKLQGGQFRPRQMLPGLIIEKDGEYAAIDAMWWFLLEQDANGWRPNGKYTTFNAHKLGLQTWRGAVKHHRAIVIADAIGESNPVPGYKTKKQQYLMEAREGLVLAALYREWPTPEGSVYSAAVITSDPHPRFSHYHAKSTPGFLPKDPAVIKNWLSKDVEAPDILQDAGLPPQLPYDLQVSEVKTFKRGEVVAGPWVLPSDDAGK